MCPKQACHSPLLHPPKMGTGPGQSPLWALMSPFTCWNPFLAPYLILFRLSLQTQFVYRLLQAVFLDLLIGNA